jgi:YD repeat-containing protein
MRRLSDGGKVFFDHGRVTAIQDPYGVQTTITWDPINGGIGQVKEAGGRYLTFIYGTEPDGRRVLARVDAHGHGDSTVTDSVAYKYELVSPGGSGPSVWMLNQVDYSDNTHAYYDYVVDNVTDLNFQGIFKIHPLLSTCDDVRYNGPMAQIWYEYEHISSSYSAPHGAIAREKNFNGAYVSTVSPPLPSATFTEANSNPDTTYKETRGDGPSRTFNYTPLKIGSSEVGERCPNYLDSPHQQMLLSYTDFQGNTTYLEYDANWFVKYVRDARSSGPTDARYMTTYERGPSIGEVTKMTHPDGTFIQYTYYDATYNDPHYLASRTDERGNTTTYHRDPTTHRVTSIDYPPDNNGVVAHEAFLYNSFGQVTRHQRKNGAYEHFAYDGRGLLTDKWNPTLHASPQAGDPKTHYDYYTSGPWVDRVKVVTHPANISALVATETFEYDKKYDDVGVMTTTGCPGRGLVTKITHADKPSNTWELFAYDIYGHKVWQENELRERTSFEYNDPYNRLTKTIDPLGHATTYSYGLTNRGTGAPGQHTTNSVTQLTDPANVLTLNEYDENFRKQTSTVASGTVAAAKTSFDYDEVGNPTTITDPLIHVTKTIYDSRNRKQNVIAAYGDAFSQTTTFHYDDKINLTSINRADGTTETKTYDKLNRMVTDTVPQTSTISLTTAFVYNLSGTIQKVTDPKLQATTFLYNEADLKTRMTYPNGSYQAWGYDGMYNLTSRRSVSGATQSFPQYDIRNRQTRMQWDNDPDYANFDYDDAGRLTIANNANSAVTRIYDRAGRLTDDIQNVTGSSNFDVHYTYDTGGNTGRLTEINIGAGYDAQYDYDEMGRLQLISTIFAPRWQSIAMIKPPT